jgi:hypothetical protein
VQTCALLCGRRPAPRQAGRRGGSRSRTSKESSCPRS